jgi:methionyl-tRNA formyltransferase
MAHSSQDQQPWRVVLCTNIPFTPALIRASLDALGHKLVAVVTTPGPRARRSNDYLEVVANVPPGIDIIVTNRMKRLASLLAPFEPDLMISAGFPWRFPPEVIALPPRGAVNVHPSLLPRHRGPHPIEWALRDGVAQTGVTLHRLGAEFDTGAILSQIAIPIEDDDDNASIISRLIERMPELIRDGLTCIADGSPGTPQDETQASDTRLFEPGFRFIDWTQPARTIHNQVRSWTGFRGVDAGAIGTVDGTQRIILKTRLTPGNETGDAIPGTLLAEENGELLVQCGDGPLSVTEWIVLDEEMSATNMGTE